MSWEFKPGMRVVCINDRYGPDALRLVREAGIILPQKSAVYTVRDVFTYDAVEPRARILLLRLDEIRNCVIPWLDGTRREPAYTATRFRPLDESRLDVFRNLLVDLPKEEELA